jgi:ribosomal protein S18 acetylase RimI-like enzyme
VAVDIRPATLEDAEEIAEVHVASWRWAYRGLMPSEVLDGLSRDRRRDMWRSLLSVPDPRSVVLVAVQDGAIVGFASAGSARDARSSTTSEVFAIYLLEHATGRGIGRRLFEDLLRRLRELGYTRATLSVLATNALARRFYEAAGWKVDGAEDGYEVGGVRLPEVRYAVDL